MLFFLISSCFSVNFGPHVTTLTMANFESEVDNRSNTTVYFVMFHGQHCPACQMAYPDFMDAAAEAYGMIKFGHVDTSNEYLLGSRFRIYTIPHFMIFYPGGEKVYQRERYSRTFLNVASAYVPDLSIKIDQDWIKSNQKSKAPLDFEGQKLAILFSNRQVTPPMWAGISCAFQNNTENIAIAFCNDQNISQLFNVTIYPTILLIDGAQRLIYNGRNKFPEIKKKIDDFFNGFSDEFTSKSNTITQLDDMTSLEDFSQKCKGKGRFCVVQGGGNNQASADFLAIANKYRHDHFQFFICSSEKCPLDYVSKFSNQQNPKIWIFHHKKDAAILVDSISTLASTLDRVADGGARFHPIDKLKEEIKDL